MSLRRRHKLFGGLVLATVMVGAVGCESYFFLPGFGDPGGSGALLLGGTFTGVLIQERTFTSGPSVTAITYASDDPQRIPLAVDFNNDGKTDPVVGYAQNNRGVVQILLSKGAAGTVDFTSLTLDGNDRWQALADVAVGDIDNDGQLDIVAATGDGVVYLHHPPLDSADTADARTSFLRQWGNQDPELEFLAGSTETLSNAEIEAILSDTAPVGFNANDWDVAVVQGYSNVEIADFNADGFNDIVASRSFQLTAAPKSEVAGVPFEVIGGQLQIFLNPGGATTGELWQSLSVGRHERYLEVDRQGAVGLLVYDVDGDGDLDLLSAAGTDNNAQIAWFEHPGVADPATSLGAWTQWRVGSVRGGFAVDIGDVTGDGRADVVATSGEQMQMVLFEQPADDPRREYDWDTHAIVTFQTFAPRDVKMLDIDDDGVLELVVGGTNGAVRYFERPLDPTSVWTGVIITTFDEQGTVSLLGYGDLDGDGDLDLVVTLATGDDNQSRTDWIRNNLAN